MPLTESWCLISLLQATTCSLVSNCACRELKSSNIYFYPVIGLWNLKVPFLACITVNIVTGPPDLFSMFARPNIWPPNLPQEMANSTGWWHAGCGSPVTDTFNFADWAPVHASEWAKNIGDWSVLLRAFLNLDCIFMLSPTWGQRSIVFISLPAQPVPVV